MPDRRRKRSELIEYRLTFARAFKDRSWHAHQDVWLALCHKGPHDWFILPEDLGKLDLVISTTSRDGYPLRRLRSDSSLFGAYWRREYVTFSGGVNSWLTRIHRGNPNRKFYAAIEFSTPYKTVLV